MDLDNICGWRTATWSSKNHFPFLCVTALHALCFEINSFWIFEWINFTFEFGIINVTPLPIFKWKNRSHGPYICTMYNCKISTKTLKFIINIQWTTDNFKYYLMKLHSVKFMSLNHCHSKWILFGQSALIVVLWPYSRHWLDCRFKGICFWVLAIGQYSNQNTSEAYELLLLEFSMASGKSAYNIIIFGFIRFIFRSIFIGFHIQQNVCASIK